jgi:hypothetical protein
MRTSYRLALLSALVVLALSPAPPAAAQLQPGFPCLVPGPGYWCIGNVTFSSYYKNGPFKPIQANSNSGSFQPDVVVNLSPFVRVARVHVMDSDYLHNRVYVYQGSPYSSYYLPFPADGKPGVFSVNGYQVNSVLTSLRLQSDSSDYVNWYVEYKVNTGDAFWCRVQAASGSCGGASWSVSPFQQNTPFDPFQSVDNYSGFQVPIDIQFGAPAYTVAVTAVDADYPNSYMEAYGANGSLLGTVSFVGDNNPGTTTWGTKSITDARGIWKVRLVNDPNDYVAWQGLTVTPGY